jgi:DNA-binding transcriptional LysR family regulator
VLESARRTSTKTLKIAASRVLLPEMLKQYRGKCPGINVQITVCPSDRVLKMLSDEEVQLGLARSLGSPDMNAIHLYNEEVILVTHPDHPFAKCAAVSIHDVADESLILYDPSSRYFELINQVCSDAGVTPLVGMHLDGIEATKNMVKLGLGISFLPSNAVREELKDGTLTTIRVTELQPMTVPIYVLIRRTQHYSPPVLAFLGLLEQMYRIDIPLLRERVIPAI